MLIAGTQLGPYEIVAPLGAGGMGEVYRAWDTRLERVVAIKVLRPGNDGDRVSRLEREARAAGQLSHPAILAIYDVGEHEGSPYIVSELLDGESLADTLARGALSIARALELARELAQGLAAAHERGIIHRDLKPGNLFITRDGRLKILDFGLAKQLPMSPAAREDRDASTLPGTVLGTPGYMAPEQVRGDVTDHRADLFAFGAVLYEMLSGRRAFDGASSVEVMNAVLTAEPPPITTTPALARVLRHCLEKRAPARFQSARDLAFELDAQSEGPTVREAPRRATGQRWRNATIALLSAIIAIAAYRAGRLAPRRSLTWHQLSFGRGSLRHARFAPEGGTIVYGAAWSGAPTEVYMTRAGEPGARSLDVRGDLLSVSSRGELAVLLDRRPSGPVTTGVGTLARVSLSGGGSPRRVSEHVHEADFLPGGEELAAVREIDGQFVIEFPLGTVVYRTAGWVSDLRASPRGDTVAFIDHPVLSDDQGRVALVDRGGHEALLGDSWISAQGLAWAPGGGEIWFTATETGANRAVHAITTRGRERLIEREPLTLTLQDIGADGRVLLTRESFRGEIKTGRPGDTSERDLTWLDAPSACDVSEDGKSLLGSEGGEGGGASYGVYLLPTSGAPPMRLGNGRSCAISPDGRSVIVLTGNTPAQLALLPTGAGERRALTADAIDHRWARFSHDGTTIVFCGNEPGHKQRLWVMPSAGGAPRAISPEGLASRQFAPSPDGHHVVGVDGEGALVSYATDGGESHPVRGAVRGDLPIRWSSDGAHLYVVASRTLPARVELLELATGHRTTWRKITPADPAGVPDISDVLVTPDGSRYVYSEARLLDDLFVVDGMR